MSSTWLPLIRSSRIVSTAVDEILERDPLRAAGGEQMTHRQLELLEFINHSGHHIDDVAKFLGISPPAATKAVDKLEQRGLVQRVASNTDRRLTLLTCSDAGLALVDRYHALQQQALALALTWFGDQEIAGLTDLLERYALALISTRKDAS